MADSKTHRLGGFETVSELRPNHDHAQGTLHVARCVEPTAPGVDKGATVVLKVIDPRGLNEAGHRRIHELAAKLAEIRHPHVVRQYGSFAYEIPLLGATPVIVMEHLSGCTLAEDLDKSPGGLNPETVLHVFRQVLDGLAHVYREKGLVHRDIKPSNIFICDDGSAKVIDFEIARLERQGSTVSTQSHQGGVHGTENYLSPEFHPAFQIDKRFVGDAVSDVFSIAVSLHQALTGRLPYTDPEAGFWQRWRQPDAARTVIRLSAGALAPLEGMEAVLTRALAVDRQERFDSYEALATALADVRPVARVPAPPGDTTHLETPASPPSGKGGDGTWFPPDVPPKQPPGEPPGELTPTPPGAHRYVCGKEIGRGGFGVVYEARCVETGELVAIKRLHLASQRERFKGEALKQQRLTTSPDAAANARYLVRFIDYYEDDDITRTPCLVMELLEGMPGSNLADRLLAAPAGLPTDEVLELFRGYALGLATLHRADIIHRDLAPANLYAPAGKPECAKIMDLGVARDGNSTFTVGGLPGRLEYWAPEMWTRNSRGSKSTDVYALGLCLYEALTGMKGFAAAEDVMERWRCFQKRAERGELPPFDRQRLRACPAALRRLLHDLLEPDAKKRVTSADAVVARLASIRLKPGAPPSASWWRAHAWQVSAAAAAVLAVSAAGVILMWQGADRGGERTGKQQVAAVVITQAVAPSVVSLPAPSKPQPPPPDETSAALRILADMQYVCNKEDWSKVEQLARESPSFVLQVNRDAWFACTHKVAEHSRRVAAMTAALRAAADTCRDAATAGPKWSDLEPWCAREFTGLRHEPVVAVACSNLTAAVLTRMEALCADLPLESRASRLEKAQRELPPQAVAEFLGDARLNGLETRIRRARDAFVLNARPVGLRVSLLPGLQPPASASLMQGATTTPIPTGLTNLPPGEYRVVFARPDYLDCDRRVALQPGAEQALEIAPPPDADWQPGIGLAALRAARADWTGRQDDRGVLALAASEPPLSWSGHRQALKELLDAVDATYRQRIETWLEQMRGVAADRRAWEFQIADPATGTLRRDTQTKPAPPVAKPDLPAVVLAHLSPPLVDVWRNPEMLATNAAGDQARKQAHTSWEMERQDKDSFPSKTVSLLAEALDQGARLNAYDVQLALYALWRCRERVELWRNNEKYRGSNPDDWARQLKRFADDQERVARNAQRLLAAALPEDREKAKAMLRSRPAADGGAGWMLEVLK